MNRILINGTFRERERHGTESVKVIETSAN